MNIEKRATSIVEYIISGKGYLDPYIDNNDKTPSWDGYVYVYCDKNTKHSKSNLRGRVPVQVKGHETENIDSETIKFSVEITDLINYRNDGGVIFIVVYLNAMNQQIYYTTLLPLDLERRIKKYYNQNTNKITLAKLPVGEKDLAEIFLNFIEDRNKQASTVDKDKLYIYDWEKTLEDEEIEHFSFFYNSVIPQGYPPFKELTTKEFYIYAKPKNFNVHIPVEKVKNAIIKMENKISIGLDKEIYYEDAYVEWKNGKPSIRCGKYVTITFMNIEKKENLFLNVYILFKGNLSERIRDLSFICSLMEREDFSINGTLIEYNNINFENSEIIYDMKFKLLQLNDVLKKYGVKKDLDIDNVQEEDNWKLEFLLDSKTIIEKYYLNLKTGRLQVLEIDNIKILFFIMEKEGMYIIDDFFKHFYNVLAVEKQNGKEMIISQFLILKAKHLIVDNFNWKNVYNDIIKYHEWEDYIINVNIFLLEVLKAYDLNSWNKEDIYELAEHLSLWLIAQSDDNIFFMNYAQTKLRKSKLNKEEINRLIKIGVSNQENKQIQAGVNILLGNYEKSNKIISNMNSKEKEEFTTYPIFYLLKSIKGS